MSGYYTTMQAAIILQVSIDTVRRMCTDGRINGAMRTRNKTYIPIAEVEKYLVPADQAAAVESAAMEYWSAQRKLNGNY